MKAMTPAARRVFIAACILQAALCAVNFDANDDHFSVIQTIKHENRLPTPEEHKEGFQPMLYHGLTAMVLKLLPFESYWFEKRVAQALSGAAGLAALYVVWLFLAATELPRHAAAALFALAAFNPPWRAIGAQVTNDSFVIAFGVVTCYTAWRYFSSPSRNKFWALTGFAVACIVTKGNGLAAAAAVLAAFVLARRYREGLVFLAVCSVAGGLLGGYVFRAEHYGSPFYARYTVEWPALFEKTIVHNPGILSVAHSFFSFPFADLLAHPRIEYLPAGFPANNASYWTLLFAQAHTVFYMNWPPAWAVHSAGAAWLERAILCAALVPTLWMLTGIAGRFAERSKGPDARWTLDLFGAAFAAFGVVYAAMYRDVSMTKAIFVLPGLLGAVHWARTGLLRLGPARPAWTACAALLTALYVADLLKLTGHLAVPMLGRLGLAV